MKKGSIIIILILALTGSLFAGDLASFMNLGFSEDSRYFMFGQYGITGETTLPYGEIYLVDVHRNQFVPRGVWQKTFNQPPQAGQNGSGALLTLFWEARERAQELKISPLSKGRMVYLLVNGEEPKSQVSFRDFKRGSQYAVTLNQQQFSSASEISAAFHLNLAVTDKAGEIKTYTIGLPNYKRPGVRQYRIRQIFFAPDEASLVFVVEREEGAATEAVNIRYMVETVYLN